MQSDFLAHKTKEHDDLKAWVNTTPAAPKEFAGDISAVEKSSLNVMKKPKMEFYLSTALSSLTFNRTGTLSPGWENTRPTLSANPGYQRTRCRTYQILVDQPGTHLC